jgi:hypothetical protein
MDNLGEISCGFRHWMASNLSELGQANQSPS